MKISLKYTNPSQAIQDSDEFVSSAYQIWRNLALIDPLKWMGAIRMRVQTTKNALRLTYHQIEIFGWTTPLMCLVRSQSFQFELTFLIEFIQERLKIWPIPL